MDEKYRGSRWKIDFHGWEDELGWMLGMRGKTSRHVKKVKCILKGYIGKLISSNLEAKQFISLVGASTHGKPMHGDLAFVQNKLF